jgi:hypothetical protein
MLPNREGRFKATILEHGVSETGPNNLATFIVKLQLVCELGNGQWNAVDEDLDITGYFYLEKRDGSLNTITIGALKSAFGWDGRDPMWLQDSDFIGHVVQVKLAFEQYQGKMRLKVQYIDAENSTGGGGVPRADDNTRRSLANRLGAKLRANAGGTPSPAPKPAGRPTSPAAARPKPAQPSMENPFRPPATTAVAADRPLNADTAWEAFQENFNKMDVDPKLIEGEWFRILGDMYPGRDANMLSSAEWTRFLAEGPLQIIPF